MLGFSPKCLHLAMAAPQIHPAANVDPSATLGEDVVVGANVTIEADAEIGARTRLYPNAFVGHYARIGEDVVIHMGAVVSHLPQDLKFDPDRETYCRIGRGTVIREYATIHRATTPGSATTVGERCFIMNNCHIAHDCQIGNDVIMASGAMLGGHVILEERAYAGPASLVHQFTRIGKLALMSGHVEATMDLPPFHIAFGRNTLRGLNVVGMKRAGLAPKTRDAIKAAHKIIFRRDLPLTQALDRLESEFNDPEVLHLARFCRESQRGIMRPAET